METVISLAVISVLMASVFSIALEVAAFVGNTDVDYSVQSEANRAFARLSEIVRKTGWNSTAGVTYPRVVAGGSELEFRALTDLDGNGHAFEASTGQLEWSPTVFTARLDPDSGVLAVYSGPDPVWVLGRHITNISFATFQQDSNLHFKEVQVGMVAQRGDRSGNPITFASTGSIYMRN